MNPFLFLFIHSGDNVLHYAVLGARVTAVDLNECQLALTGQPALARSHPLELTSAQS